MFESEICFDTMSDARVIKFNQSFGRVADSFKHRSRHLGNRVPKTSILEESDKLYILYNLWYYRCTREFINIDGYRSSSVVCDTSRTILSCQIERRVQLGEILVERNVPIEWSIDFGEILVERSIRIERNVWIERNVRIKRFIRFGEIPVERSVLIERRVQLVEILVERSILIERGVRLGRLSWTNKAVG